LDPSHFFSQVLLLTIERTITIQHLRKIKQLRDVIRGQYCEKKDGAWKWIDCGEERDYLVDWKF